MTGGGCVERRAHGLLLHLPTSRAQSYHRQREQRHRATLESSNERVQWWSIANAVTIGFVSLTTAAIIRQWFRRPTMLPGKV